ncbi:MAG: type VI secretion system baseplate subunit TssF [Marinilabiliales bacterium]|nr:type VI secretion system baseplate subunit TssF [Marinilabiliales bacterium]
MNDERKDPFVERLFEGFAFLAGRIQERLDDEFPEIVRWYP